MEEAQDANEDMAAVAVLNYDDLDNVAKLQKSQRYHDIMKVCFECKLLLQECQLVAASFVRSHIC